MTIKEVEARTGLARANIRYYEDQGFFSAARGENGYRNYSEENVDTLLKIKLLRQLDFSLEDIHALQAGEQSLEAALERRAEGLERESRELSRAAQLCRDMRTEGADFYTLDARRYLDQLAREEEVLSKDRDPVRIFPWRRYFARTLDLTLYNTLIIVVLQLTTRLNWPRMEAGGKFLLTILGLVLMMGAETVMIHLWGTTPGKALLGLKILREDGSKLSLADAGQRTAIAVLFFGFAQCLIESQLLLLQISGIAMLIWACWQVYHEHPMSWEENQLYLDGSTRDRTFWENYRNYLRVAGYLAVTAACIGLMIGGHFLAARPPHRGPNLTAEEFVDNYNQYMAFTYGEENLSRRLSPDGTFTAARQGYSVVIDPLGLSGTPEAAFRFEEEGGKLIGVTLVQQHESGTPSEQEIYYIDLPYDEIYAAMRSFLWRHLGEKKINALHNTLKEQDGTLHSQANGVQINSTVEFSGFDAASFGGFMLAKEGEDQYYRMEFTMTLTE